MKLILKLLFGILFLPAFLNAQVTTSTLSGVVKEKEGPLPGCYVSAVHLPTGTAYTVITTDKGDYHIGNLKPGGPYKITVSMLGFESQVRDNVFLTLGEDDIQDFILSPKSVELNSVTITAEKGGVKSGTRSTFDQVQIQAVPTISRSIQDVTRLTPQSNNNSFVGTNFRYNNVTIDGAINNDAIGFSPSLGGQSNSSGMMGSSTRANAISLDAIKEVQVYLAPFDVKIGNFLGGSVNAVTRSGTNNLEGSVYSFGRNSSFIGPNNAGDKSAMPKGFEDYQIGFRIGLPIIKDKLFFFTNMEKASRTDPVIFAAGSPETGSVISEQQAKDIANYTIEKYGFDPMESGVSSRYAHSGRFFNRIDWNINDKNQLTLRNNTVLSDATNMERDQQNFRFKSNDFKQVNNSTSTVLELKTKVSNTLNNSLIIGYSAVDDHRDPLADPRTPQIQIASGGGTIFLGSEREATIFNFKQKTAEFTDDVTFFKGKHSFTIGTHNEFYKIDYGFVNSWNGRLDYNSINDFLNNRPARVRGSYNYANNTRDYITGNPSAEFNINLYSFYGQDRIKISNKFTLTGGLRFDIASLPKKAVLSTKTANAAEDPNYGTTYTYTKPDNITNNILGQVQVSPRLGFNFDILGNKSFILRGGSGLFTGRIPFAWLGYSFYNNGDSYGAYDQKYSYNSAGISSPSFVGDPAIPQDNGIAYFASRNGVDVNNQASRTQVDMVDNNFKMPQVWRSSLAFDYSTKDGWKFSIEGIYTKVITDLKFQHVNLYDSPIYYPYDINKQQPVYVTDNPATSSTRISNNFTNAYLLSNTSKGYRYSITGQASKSFKFGLNATFAYTYGEAKDITNGIRNSMESNWQLNQALNPNNPDLAYSNFDIRHRIVASLNQNIDWRKKGKFLSNVALYFNAQSGQPFTYGFLNATVQGTAQQVSLAYIPEAGETINFFNPGTLNGQSGATAQQLADAFDQFIDNDPYLKSRRGTFTERNGGRTPWNVQADLRFTQDFKFGNGKLLSLNFDIVNLTNLINPGWGKAYFSPNTFNSTSSIGLRAPVTAGSATTYPKYNSFSNPGTPYAIDLFSSRYQMQVGLRFTF